MTLQKKIIIGTLVVMLVAVLFPPWGWADNPFLDRGYGFLLTGPFNPEYPGLSHVINWQILGVELFAIALIGAIALVIEKK